STLFPYTTLFRSDLFLISAGCANFERYDPFELWPGVEDSPQWDRRCDGDRSRQRRDSGQSAGRWLPVAGPDRQDRPSDETHNETGEVGLALSATRYDVVVV